MIVYKSECNYCGIVKEFASREDVERYSCSCDKVKPLLVIELQDESSVPKVLYKGEEIKLKQNVFFDWDTSGACSPGGLTYAFEHGELGNKQLAISRIERRVGGHAT